MALFLVGDTNTINQTGTTVTDESITVQQGHWYQLGEDVSNPTGVREISGVDVQDDTDTITYVENTDYELDLAKGRMYIIEGGSISNGDVLHID